MNNLNKKLYLWILIPFSILVHWAVVEIYPVSENILFGQLRLISIVIASDGLLIFLFVKYIWKWPFLYDWFVPFPNLNGTWKGELKSTWIDPKTNETISLIPITFIIKQSFVSISCILKTDDLTSSSIVCCFDIDKENQKLNLIYTYDGTPKQSVRDSSPRHFGTARFDISGFKNKKIQGNYWTDRKTDGEIDLKFLENMDKL